MSPGAGVGLCDDRINQTRAWMQAHTPNNNNEKKQSSRPRHAGDVEKRDESMARTSKQKMQLQQKLGHRLPLGETSAGQVYQGLL